MPNAFALAAQYAPEGMQVSGRISQATFLDLLCPALPYACKLTSPSPFFHHSAKVEQNRTFVIETARGKADLRSRLIEVFNSADTRGVPNGLLDYKEV